MVFVSVKKRGTERLTQQTETALERTMGYSKRGRPKKVEELQSTDISNVSINYPLVPIYFR